MLKLIPSAKESYLDGTYKDKWDQGQDPSSLACSTNCDRAHCGLEDKLEETEQHRWNRTDGLREHISMERVCEVAKHRAAFAVR